MSEHAFRLLVGWATLVIGLASLCQVFIVFKLRRVVREARIRIEDLTYPVAGTIDVTVTALHENRAQIAVMAESAGNLYRNAERVVQRVVKPVEAVIRATRFIRRVGSAMPRRGRRTLSSKGGDRAKHSHNARTALGRAGD
jgi:hypothetical protein